MIVEYMLEQVGRGDAKRAPSFIRDGGHWFNQADFTYLGWVPNLAEREFYVPDTLTELDRANTISRGLTMHSDNPMYGMEDDPGSEPSQLTTEQVSTMIGDWYDNITSTYVQKPSKVTIEYSEDAIKANIQFARKGLVVSGTPQLTVRVGDSDVVLDYVNKNYNSLTFTKSQAVSEGTSISVDTDSVSISLNSGSITDGKDDVLLSLATTSGNSDSIVV